MSTYRIGLLIVISSVSALGLFFFPTPVYACCSMMMDYPSAPELNDSQRRKVDHLMSIVYKKAPNPTTQRKNYFSSLVKTFELLSRKKKVYRVVISGVIYRLRMEVYNMVYQGIGLEDSDFNTGDIELFNITKQIINTLTPGATLDDLKGFLTESLKDSSAKKEYAESLYAGLNVLVVQYQKNNNPKTVAVLRSAQQRLKTNYIVETQSSDPKIYETLSNIYTYQSFPTPISIVFGQQISLGDIAMNFNKETVSIDALGVDTLTESVMRKNGSTSLLSVLQNKFISHYIIKITTTVSNPSLAPVGVRISNLSCLDSRNQLHNAQSRSVDSQAFIDKKTLNYVSYILLNPEESLVSCSVMVVSTDKNGNDISIQ